MSALDRPIVVFGAGQRPLEGMELREADRLWRGTWTGPSTQLCLGEGVETFQSRLERLVYSGRFLGFLAPHLLRTDWLPWGSRFPGLSRLRGILSLLETCAIQWMVCVEMVQIAVAKMHDDRYVEVRHEDLLARPRQELAACLASLELEATDDLLDRMADSVVECIVVTWPDWPYPDDPAAIEGRVGSTL